MWRFVFTMANYYRIKIDVRYSTVANATTATTNINNVLAAQGRSEQATRNNQDVFVLIVGIPTQEEANNLISALNSAWSSTARSYGKVSCVRTDDVT